MKKKVATGLTATVLFIAAVAAFVLFMGKNYIPQITTTGNVDLPEDKAQSILAVEQGFYNHKLPLFAQKIEIIELTDTRILYRVHYFPFGGIDRSFSQETDGSWLFNLERPLSGIN